MTRKHLVCFTIIIIFLFVTETTVVNKTYANPIDNDTAQLELGNSVSRYELMTFGQTFLDVDKRSMDSIKADQLDSFMNSLRAADMGFSAGVYWLQIEVINTSDTDRWTLHVNNNQLPRFDLQIFSDNQQLLKTSSSEKKLKLSDFNMRGRALSFQMLRHSKHTLLLRLELNSMSIVPAVILMPTEHYREWSKMLDFAFLPLLGTVIALTLYSFSLSINLRESSYFWLFMIGSFVIVDMLQLSGLHSIFPLVKNAAETHTSFIYSWMSVFMICFCRSSIDSKENLPRLDIVLIVLLVIALIIVLITPFVPEDILQTMIWIQRPLIMITSILAAWLRLRQGLRLAVYLMAGSLLALSTELLWNVEIIYPHLYDWFAYPDLLTYGAFSIKLLLFSLALSERVTLLEGEKLAAQQSSHNKSQFLAAASHDLRQPLHATGLFVSAIDTEIHSKKGLQMLAKVQRSLSRMSLLFDSILDISRLDAGMVNVKKQKLLLSQLLLQLDEEFSPLAQEKGIQLKCIDSSLMVETDPLLLERVLRNLLSNAIRYTPEGKVLIGCRRCQQYVHIEVWDSGIGIDKVKQQSIFDEYSQIQINTGDSVRGLGLGLAIVKRTIALLNIELQLRSWPGKGSVFSLTLPIVETSKLQLNQPLDNHDLTKIDIALQVVIIDNDLVILEAMESLLSQWGCHVILARNTESALLKINQHAISPDVLLADAQISTTETGLESIKLFQQKWGIQISCALITGDTTSQNIQLAQQLGLTVFLKPLRPVSLRRYLTKIAEKAKTSHQEIAEN